MADQLLLAELISEDDSIGGSGPDRIRLLDKDSFKLLKMLTTMIQETSKTVENDLDQERKSEERPQDFESTSLAGQSREELINDSIQSSADDVDDCVCVAWRHCWIKFTINQSKLTLNIIQDNKIHKNSI